MSLRDVRVAIDCGSPGVLRDGLLSGERFDYPNIIAFFCNDGFELVGKDTTRACQENGLWSGTMPVCQSNRSFRPASGVELHCRCVGKSCRTPPAVSNSEIIQPDRTTNETIQYICLDGYQLRGSSILTCNSFDWQPDPPTCERE